MSHKSPIILLLLTLLTYILINTVSSQCSNLDQSSCTLDGYCTYTNNECICGQTWNQDIAFIFDSSMSALEFTYSKEFARDILKYASPSTTTTRAAIYQTGSGTNSSTLTTHFDALPLSTIIDNTLETLQQNFQSRFYLQISLQQAVDLFNANSTSNTRKILIIFATQEFAESPCLINTRANGIFTYTIVIGRWNSYPLICVGSSENNYEGLQTVDNAEQLVNLLPTMEAIVCPHHPLLKVTEIQLVGSPHRQYIELYNYGHTIADMSVISLGGIGTGALDSTSLPQGSYGIIYNTDANDMSQSEIPNCSNCACTEDTGTVGDPSGIKWCENAIYYGCCDSGNSGCINPYSFENIVSDCSFNTGLSMTSFTVEIIYTDAVHGAITIQSIEFNSGKQWPIVGTNYALELKNKGYNNQFGSSWAMSCDTDGTPGDDYLSTPCSFTCSATQNIWDMCDLNGGHLYDADAPEKGCTSPQYQCDCITGYYPHYHTCLPLPAPSNCTAREKTLSASSASFIVADWDGDTTYTYFHCEALPGICTGPVKFSKSTTSLLDPLIYDPGKGDDYTNATEFTLSTTGTGGETWYSDHTICIYVTGSPTTDPTPSPTMSIPLVPSCNITLSSDLKSFDISWEPLTHDPTSATSFFDGYVYYFNDIRRASASCSPECKIENESPPGSAKFNLTKPDNVSVSGDWDSVKTDVTSLEELLSSTVCNVITQAPTMEPTTIPTENPTPAPTANPSRAPTPAPTLGELTVPSCSATVIPRTQQLDMSWEPANFTNSTAIKADTIYFIEWFYNNDKTYTGNNFEIVFANQAPRPISVVDYLNISVLQMYLSWGGYTVYGPRTNCTIYTHAPTPAPTNIPSTTPTKSPSKTPSKSPSKSPSQYPTASPTYTYDDVIWCHAVFNIQFEYHRITLTWGLLQVDDTNPTIPPSGSIFYEGTIGDSGTTTIGASHTTNFIDCNQTILDNTQFDDCQTYCESYLKTNNVYPNDCRGSAAKTLDINSGGWDGITKAKFQARYTLGLDIRHTNSINCTVDTPEPTLSPSTEPTRSPTRSPTLGEVWVYLDNTACQEERCGCRSTQPSEENPDCCYNACEWDRQPAPVIIVSEKSQSNTTFYVKRNIENYPYTIQVEFNVTAVTRELAFEYGFYDRVAQIEAGDYNDVDVLNETNITNSTTAVGSNITYVIPPDCYFENVKCDSDSEDNWDTDSIDDDLYKQYACADSKKRGHSKHECSWCDYHYIPGPRCNDITPLGGRFVIPHTDLANGGTFEQATFELSILTEKCTDGCDYKGEVFMLELTKCRVIENYNTLSSEQLRDLGANIGRDILNCTLIYPTRAFIIVVDQDVINIVEEEVIADDSYNDWLWYVIVGAVILLAGLSYVAYIWWKNKKLKEADVAQVEKDMEEVIEEQEKGWQAGDDVIVAPANPLAQIGGVQRPIGSMGADFTAPQTEKIKDVADVGVEKFDERIEYGQQRGDFGDVL
eukprot:464259_1